MDNFALEFSLRRQQIQSCSFPDPSKFHMCSDISGVVEFYDKDIFQDIYCKVNRERYGVRSVNGISWENMVKALATFTFVILMSPSDYKKVYNILSKINGKDYKILCLSFMYLDQNNLRKRYHHELSRTCDKALPF